MYENDYNKLVEATRESARIIERDRERKAIQQLAILKAIQDANRKESKPDDS